ncbi:MAG: toll/interleukin-1 receptor domain-containing protein [Acidobacteriota bacterium]|nr:toll/interleukin-1 receptor domain-containing protein [Acidobacteriota bacterium]
MICGNGHPVNRAVVRDHLRRSKGFAFCPECGDKVVLPKADEPIQLTRAVQREVEEQQWFAAERTKFEQAIFQVMSYVDGRKMTPPECFISYAWGNREHEHWVEQSLAKDLRNAGISVVLDQWKNSRVGANVSRFIESIGKCDYVIVVGTRLYRKKYENEDTDAGYAVAAEGDLITRRMRGTEARKETVLPVLLEGDEESSFPPLVQGRVYADFRNKRAYFIKAFDLILDIYKIAHDDPAVADLRELLRARYARAVA